MEEGGKNNDFARASVKNVVGADGKQEQASKYTTAQQAVEALMGSWLLKIMKASAYLLERVTRWHV